MAISVPPPQGISFDALMEQARALIPALDPGWTDHNPSDPGIALVEMLAWLSEMLIFQAEQVPQAHVASFLTLLNGPDPVTTPTDPGTVVPAAATAAPLSVRDTVLGLRERYRSVTVDDYEHLVAAAWPGSDQALALDGADAVVQRITCLAQRDLSLTDADARAEPAPGHVSLVVLPGGKPGSARPAPSAELTRALAEFLEPRRILATHNHVVGPEYVEARVSASIALQADSPPDATLTTAQQRIAAFLDPYTGGTDGQGWPFGRNVWVSDLYAALERLSLIDYVEDVTVTGAAPILDDSGAVCGLELLDHQLVQLTGVDLVAYDPAGRTYPFTWTGPA